MGSGLSQLTMLGTEVSQILTRGSIWEACLGLQVQSVSSLDSSVFGNFYHHSAPFPIMGCRKSSEQRLEQVC